MIHSNPEGYAIHNLLYISFMITTIVDILGKYKYVPHEIIHKTFPLQWCGFQRIMEIKNEFFKRPMPIFK